MPLQFTNISFIRTFIRNLDNIPESSRRAAENLADEMESIVLSRVSSGRFLEGSWKNKPYSENPIKAYKLGNAVVSGQGMSKTLTIDGILIDRDDWYWGRYERKKKGVSLSSGRDVQFFGDSTPKPVPVFIPGYKEWRVRYNGLSGQVDLNFRGNMLDNFGVDIIKTRGSNQYGGNFEFDFVVEEPFSNIGDITDYYRGWMAVTEDELSQAIKESGASISSILLK